MLGSSIDGISGSIDGENAPAIAGIIGFFRVYPNFTPHYIFVIINNEGKYISQKEKPL